jgi:hypothetical protein
MKMSKLITNEVIEIFELIDTGNVNKFIEFAKDYNIFQESNSKFYTQMCQRIRDRLNRENLNEDILR